jgi:hypothetical protein
LKLINLFFNAMSFLATRLKKLNIPRKYL